MVVVFAGVGQHLYHQLQRPGAIPGHAVDEACLATPVRPSRELSGDDKALVGNLHILGSHVPKQCPAARLALVCLDGRFQQIVNLLDPVEPLEALHGHNQIVSDGGYILVQQQLSQAVVSVLEVALVERVLKAFPLGFEVLGRGTGLGREGQGAHEHARQDRQQGEKGNLHGSPSTTWWVVLSSQDQEEPPATLLGVWGILHPVLDAPRPPRVP